MHVAESAPGSSPSTRLLFAAFVMSMMFVNFDSGGCAAVIPYFDKGCANNGGDPHYPCLTESDQGMLGALPYIGLCVGCFFAGRFLQVKSEQFVICIGLAANTMATCMFAFVTSRRYLFLAKFMIGVTQSAICVYVPVWVDRFAPISRRASWLGIVQGVGVVGCMVGYAIAGYLTASGFYYQIAFRIQACFLLFCTVILAMVPKSLINVSAHSVSTEERSGSLGPFLQSITPLDRTPVFSRAISDRTPAFSRAISDRTPAISRAITPLTEASMRTLASNVSMTFGRLDGDGLLSYFSESVLDVRTPRIELNGGGSVQSGSGRQETEHCCDQVSQICTNWLFMTTTAGMCVLFFGVAAIQFWVSEFFVVCFKRDPTEVTTVFLVVAGSGPVIGVLAGGAITDRVSDGAMLVTAKLASLWSLFAVVAGVGAAAVPLHSDELDVSVCFFMNVMLIYVLLLFGGAMVPACTGLILWSVPVQQKSLANAFTVLFYNMIGYALGSGLPGQVSYMLESRGWSQEASLHFAMRVVFVLSSSCGLIFMTLTLCAAKTRSESGERGNAGPHSFAVPNVVSQPISEIESRSGGHSTE